MHSVSVKLSDEDYQWLDNLASDSQRSKSDIMRETLEQRRTDYLKWKTQKVKSGLDAVAAGEVVTSQEMSVFVDELKDELRYKYT